MQRLQTSKKLSVVAEKNYYAGQITSIDQQQLEKESGRSSKGDNNNNNNRPRGTSKENKLHSQDLVRNSIQIRKMNPADLLINKRKKQVGNSSIEFNDRR